jgi:hypothetical protein
LKLRDAQCARSYNPSMRSNVRLIVAGWFLVACSEATHADVTTLRSERPSDYQQNMRLLCGTLAQIYAGSAARSESELRTRLARKQRCSTYWPYANRFLYGPRVAGMAFASLASTGLTMSAMPKADRSRELP